MPFQMLEHAVHIWSVAVSVAEFSSKIVPHQNVHLRTISRRANLLNLIGHAIWGFFLGGGGLAFGVF